VSDPSAFLPESGMTEGHFKAFKDVAREQQVIAVVRNTNPASVKLIEMGCPGKPLCIKFHTSESTGVVTAANPGEVAHARTLGYYVVDQDRVARGAATAGKGPAPELRLTNAFWRLEPGQIIDPKARKPLVGDYDLMGVFSTKNPGQNIALVAKDGKELSDVSSPIVRKFAERVNAKLDRPRVLHGAQDQYAGFRGSATAFLPDGTTVLLRDEQAVKRFYDEYGRQPRTGSYNKSIPAVPSNAILGGGGRVQGVFRNQAAMAALGVAIAAGIQALGDIGIQRQIDRQLETTHAEAIKRILARGHGVLIVIRLQEWQTADFNGMRARGLLGVYVVGGATREKALEEWRKPKYLQGPPKGWRVMPEQYLWIDPAG
jgi:hypothetical protein